MEQIVESSPAGADMSIEAKIQASRAVSQVRGRRLRRRMLHIRITVRRMNWPLWSRKRSTGAFRASRTSAGRSWRSSTVT